MQEPPIPPGIMAEGFVNAVLIELGQELAKALHRAGGDARAVLTEVEEAVADRLRYGAREARKAGLHKMAEANVMAKKRFKEAVEIIRQELGPRSLN